MAWNPYVIIHSVIIVPVSDQKKIKVNAVKTGKAWLLSTEYQLLVNWQPLKIGII